MTRRASSGRTRTGPEEPVATAGGGFGGMLRGSVNSMVGAAGLNLPLRAVERLTSAVEHAAITLERLERATAHLDRIDGDFLDRIHEAVDALTDMSDDTRAIRERMDGIEAEIREMRELVTNRLDRVPLLRPRRRDRAQAAAAGKEPKRPAK
jgi:hypothetical protein